MKLYGIAGKASGKLGSTVYAVRGGEQLVRQYNPVVANPSTPAQVAVRAKLKLMSQLASAVSPVIAIKSQGLKSSRNLFVKQNYSKAIYSSETASIALDKIQLTKSQVAFPAITLERGNSGQVSAKLADAAGSDIDRVVYSFFKKQDDGSLQLIEAVASTEAGSNGDFPVTSVTTENGVVCLAYGVRLNSDKAHAIFDNINVPATELVAKLKTAIQEDAADVTLTATSGAQMNAGADSGEISPDVDIVITTRVEGNGQATGAGNYFLGDQVTLVATATGNAQFLGWYLANDLVTSNTTYSFTATRSQIYVAKFKQTPGED